MAMAFLLMKISGPSIVPEDDNGKRIGSCCVTLPTNTLSSHQVQCSLIVQFSAP